MNCDQAFEHLTDPTLQDSAELRRHLAGCRRCRQMQETLAPALALFEGAGSTSSSNEMPAPETATTGTAGVPARPATPAPDAVRLAREAASILGPVSATVASRGRRGSLLHCAAAFAIGVGCSWSLFSFGLFPRQTGFGSKPAQPGSCLWTNRNSTQNLVAPTAKTIAATCVACHLAPQTAH